MSKVAMPALAGTNGKIAPKLGVRNGAEVDDVSGFHFEKVAKAEIPARALQAQEKAATQAKKFLAKRAQEKSADTPAAAEPNEAAMCFTVPKHNLQVVRLTLVGTSPLIQHAFSEKARKQIEDKQQGLTGGAKGKQREKRNPKEEFEAASYRDAQGRYCMPARCIKAALIESVRFIPGNQTGREFPMTIARGMLQILGDLQPMYCKAPILRTDMARLQTGVCSPVYRPEFWPWGVEFQVQFNANLISLEDIGNLFMLAGFHSGLNEWRPERGGNFGMFRLADDDDMKLLKKLK